MVRSWEPTPHGRRKATSFRRRVGQSPNGLARRSHRGRRAGHVRKGSPGTWETSSSPAAELRRYRQAKATKRGEMDDEESERAERALRRGNRAKGTPRSKGRAGTWQPRERTMDETSGSTPISTRIERIATLARQLRDQPLTTLAHHIDLDWLREAHRRTRKGGATGVDGQTADEYAMHLEDNLRSLLERAKSGTYRAPPVRRTYIPKDSGEMRPLGIPTFEDKVLQRAVAMVLEAVYEQEFLDCSYGFRPGRSAQQALDVLHREASKMAGGWIIEIDIRKYFDSIDHERPREVLHGRIRDGVLQRLIGKWLNAGVLEEGAVTRSESGSPQGGVVSPVLANIFLHTVLDVWFVKEVRPRLCGRAHLVRYADDAVMLFGTEEDARRVMALLPERFGRYGLTLHPDKTRLVAFKRPDRMSRPRDGEN